MPSISSSSLRNLNMKRSNVVHQKRVRKQKQPYEAMTATEHMILLKKQLESKNMKKTPTRKAKSVKGIPRFDPPDSHIDWFLNAKRGDRTYLKGKDIEVVKCDENTLHCRTLVYDAKGREYFEEKLKPILRPKSPVPFYAVSGSAYWAADMKTKSRLLYRVVVEKVIDKNSFVVQFEQFKIEKLSKRRMLVQHKGIFEDGFLHPISYVPDPLYASSDSSNSDISYDMDGSTNSTSSGSNNSNITRSGRISKRVLTEFENSSLYEINNPNKSYGRPLKVFWPLDNYWYNAYLGKYDSATKKHVVRYVDGHVETLSLAKETIEILPWPTDVHGNTDNNPTTECEVGEKLVGRPIKIFWLLDQRWYGGFVEAYDKSTKKHTIRYYDGVSEELLLAKEVVKYLSWPWKFSEENTSEEKKKKRKKGRQKRSLDISDMLRLGILKVGRVEIRYNGESFKLGKVHQDASFSLGKKFFATPSGFALHVIRKHANPDLLSASGYTRVYQNGISLHELRQKYLKPASKIREKVLDKNTRKEKDGIINTRKKQKNTSNRQKQVLNVSNMIRLGILKVGPVEIKYRGKIVTKGKVHEDGSFSSGSNPVKTFASASKFTKHFIEIAPKDSSTRVIYQDGYSFRALKRNYHLKKSTKLSINVETDQVSENENDVDGHKSHNNYQKSMATNVPNSPGDQRKNGKLMISRTGSGDYLEADEQNLEKVIENKEKKSKRLVEVDNGDATSVGGFIVEAFARNLDSNDSININSNNANGGSGSNNSSKKTTTITTTTTTTTTTTAKNNSSSNKDNNIINSASKKQINNVYEKPTKKKVKHVLLQGIQLANYLPPEEQNDVVVIDKNNIESRGNSSIKPKNTEQANKPSAYSNYLSTFQGQLKKTIDGVSSNTSIKETNTETNTQFNQKDALAYLNKVEGVFSQESNVFKEFLKLLTTFKNSNMDVKIAIEKVLQLFNGHDELILAFNTFLPQNLQITLEQIVEMRIKRQKKKKKKESNDRTGGKRKRKVVLARKPKKKKKNNNSTNSSSSTSGNKPSCKPVAKPIHKHQFQFSPTNTIAICVICSHVVRLT